MHLIFHPPNEDFNEDSYSKFVTYEIIIRETEDRYFVVAKTLSIKVISSGFL